MFALSVLLAHKVFAIKVKKIHFIHDFIVKGDAKIHQYNKVLLKRYYFCKKVVEIFIFDFIPRFLYELIVRTANYFSKIYNEALEDFRGRKVLRSSESASFFLERLSKEKSDISNHKA